MNISTSAKKIQNVQPIDLNTMEPLVKRRTVDGAGNKRIYGHRGRGDESATVVFGKKLGKPLTVINSRVSVRVEKAILHRYSEESIDRIAECSSDNCCEGFWSVLVKLSEGIRIFAVGSDRRAW